MFLLTLIGALAEVATLSAVLPFLAIMADPQRAVTSPLLQSIFASLGWVDQSKTQVHFTVLFVILALCAGALRLVLLWATSKFTARLGHDLASQVYSKTLYQPYIYHISTNNNELLAGIAKVQWVTLGVILPFMNAWTGVIIGSFILSALLVVDVGVAIGAGIALGVVYLSITLFSRGVLRANSGVIAASEIARIKVVREGAGGIRDILLDQTQPVYVKTFQNADLKLGDAMAVNSFIGAAPRYVIEATGMVLIASLALTLSQGKGGLVESIPMLGALALGSQRLLPLIQTVYNSWSQIVGNRQQLADVLAFLDLPVDQRLHNCEECKALAFTREITIDAVDFQYEKQGPRVLDQISLQIDKGERVAIVGKTGSGKSTLIDVLMGLMPPASGEIRIDGIPLTAENIRSWQCQIAHVPQAIFLSDASIAENIAFGADPTGVDLARVRHAAARAHIAEYIESLPSGYSTMVGEQGVRLSGGQRQRIGLARALYRSASVLVLDEATNALDGETEAAVMESIRRLGRDLTIIIIAHRMATVEICDRCFLIKDGGISEIPVAKGEKAGLEYSLDLRA